MVKLYEEVLGDNCIFEVLGTPTRDSNILNIHSNNEGRLVYSTYDVYDIDIMRIIRVLNHARKMYNKKSTKEICEWLNNACAYLYIDINKLR